LTGARPAAPPQRAPSWQVANVEMPAFRHARRAVSVGRPALDVAISPGGPRMRRLKRTQVFTLIFLQFLQKIA